MTSRTVDRPVGAQRAMQMQRAGANIFLRPSIFRKKYNLMPASLCRNAEKIKATPCLPLMCRLNLGEKLDRLAASKAIGSSTGLREIQDPWVQLARKVRPGV